MKKIISFLLTLIIVLSLSSCIDVNTTNYKITLELDGGIGDSSIVEENGTAITLPTPIKDGYTFGGWYEDTNFTTESTLEVMPKENITLYAQWLANEYSITLELDGGIGETSIIEDYGTALTTPTPTKEGYTFGGWYKDTFFIIEYTFTTMPKEDITLYAEWLINEYTITLHLNGGTGTTSIVEDYGTTIIEPIPTKDGYTFGGWYLSTEFTTEYVFDTMPADDITLYAQWLINAYTITLELDGGIGNDSIVENYGTAITEPIPTKEGYTFGGWYTDIEFTTEYVFDTMPAEDITLYAQWDIIEYNLTLSSNVEGVTPTFVKGDIVGDKQTYTITAPEMEGYEFKHWQVLDTTITVSAESTFVFTPSSDVSLEAIYEEVIIIVVPTLFYESNFEDAAKAAYAQGLVTLSGESWNFVDALIGSLATDLSVSGNSVRIRDGYIETQFAVGDLAHVFFHAGTYGSDDDATVTFQISVDGTSWVTVDTFTSTGTLKEYDYVFDDAMFTSLSLDPDSSYYFKIISSAAGRTNIDDFQIYTGEGQVIDDTPLYIITFTDEMEFSYLLNTIVDLTECVATHPVSGPTTCDVTGTVDSSVAGVYEVTFYKTDEFGNTASETVNITVINEDTTDYLSMDLFAYYDDAEGLFGSSLMDALHIIVNDGFNGVTYGDARYILDETDQDPNNPSNLILVYLGISINSTWDYGTTWNREHIWPQSLLGESADNGTVNSASDLYNLMPANPGENSSRGNSPYSEMGLGYEPRDEVKGDVARALFYMMIMYDQLDLVDTAPGIYEMGYLNELLQWHLDDPVDDFEMNRLEVIYSYQSNRNPFVDYPHFVELIWFYVQ